MDVATFVRLVIVAACKHGTRTCHRSGSWRVNCLLIVCLALILIEFVTIFDLAT